MFVFFCLYHTSFPLKGKRFHVKRMQAKLTGFRFAHSCAVSGSGSRLSLFAHGGRTLPDTCVLDRLAQIFPPKREKSLNGPELVSLSLKRQLICPLSLEFLSKRQHVYLQFSHSPLWQSVKKDKRTRNCLKTCRTSPSQIYYLVM